MNLISAIKFWINPKQHYKDNEYLLRKWAKKVYKKCNNTCKRCGIKGIRAKNKDGKTYWKDVKIHAHHVEPKNKYPKLVYKVSNGECLCEDCHTEAKDSFHVMYGKYKGREFFDKWLKETARETAKNNNSYTKIAVWFILILGFVDLYLVLV